MALTILDPPIHFTRPLHDLVVDLKKNVEFLCEVSEPMAKVQWFKDGRLIEAEDYSRFSFEEIDQVRKMIITSVAQNDVGCYTCLTEDNRNTHCNLHVKLPEFKIEQGLEDVSIFTGDACEFKVVLSTGDIDDCQWLLDNEPVPSEFFTETRDFNEFSLTAKPGFFMEGSSCITFQATKDILTTAVVTVKEKPIKWEERIEDCEVREGLDIVLKCKLSVPNVQAYWYVNNTSIKDDPTCRFNIVQDGCYHKLVIKNATFHDEGEYACIAANGRKTFGTVKIKELVVRIVNEPPKKLQFNEKEKLEGYTLAYIPTDCDVDLSFGGEPMDKFGFDVETEITTLTSCRAMKVTISHDHLQSEFLNVDFPKCI